MVKGLCRQSKTPVIVSFLHFFLCLEKPRRSYGTRTLALEYASRRIRINNVAPGAIITPINPWAHDEEKLDKIRAHILMQEIGKAQEIAKGMLFLASEDSFYVTGQTLFIDGGLTLYHDFGEDWTSH